LIREFDDNSRINREETKTTNGNKAKKPFKVFRNSHNERDRENNKGQIRRGERNSDDDFEKYLEHRIKKKMKVERRENGLDDEKSPYSEVEHKTSGDFSSKKGSMHERYEALPYSEEFPRRSQREKREPSKTFENKIFG
jgi:hypothetical protein